MLTPRTASVVIYQGDDLQRLSDLARRVQVAQRQAAAQKAPLRVGDAPASVGVDEARAEYNAFLEEAAPRAVVVDVVAIGRRKFRALMADHPARKVKSKDGGEQIHQDDALYDVDMTTFPEALLMFVDEEKRTIAAPEFATSQARADFLNDEIADGDFETLFETAYWLNRSPGADPKDVTFSTEPQISAGT